MLHPASGGLRTDNQNSFNRRRQATKGDDMKESLLKEQRILAVDDEPDVLALLEEEIMEACPKCTFEKAESYEKAVELMISWTYDIVILDIMGVRGFDLLDLARDRHLPVLMLTAHALSPQALKRSIEKGARAYLPKEKLGELVPFLEDLLRYESLPGWRRLFERMGDFFNHRFGPDWQKDDEQFWKDFNRKTQSSLAEKTDGPGSRGAGRGDEGIQP
jgi:CheY-like chemotaxis protein